MLVFQKKESRKFIEDKSSLIPILEKDGWELIAEVESAEETVEKAKKAADKAAKK